MDGAVVGREAELETVADLLEAVADRTEPESRLIDGIHGNRGSLRH